MRRGFFYCRCTCCRDSVGNLFDPKLNMPSQFWQADNNRMRLRMDRFVALVDPCDPAKGVHDLLVDQQAIGHGQFLQIDLPFLSLPGTGTNCDCYIRGGDLVATYPEQAPAGVRAQIYWRATSHPVAAALAAIELVASVQTSRLDSCPTITTRSEMIARVAFQLVSLERGTFADLMAKPDHSASSDAPDAPQCYLFRLSSTKYSYVEMVHPADAYQTSWDGWLQGLDFRLQLSHRLFPDRLEKGVILRARVLGVVLDRDGDQDAAVQHYAAFLNEELPLTT